jgi:hypothetical protein
MGADEYFALASELTLVHRPHLSDWNMVARLAQLGLRIGQPFDLSAQDDAVQLALEAAPGLVRRAFASRTDAAGVSANGWTTQLETMAVWGNSYFKRAAVAVWGLGANPPEESLYPTCSTDVNGEALTGSRRYRIHFEPGQSPPVRAFWSLTAYDLQGYTVANDLRRYAVGDLTGLVVNDDGSCDVYLAHSALSDEWGPNWLPVPDGRFVLTLRLYLPERSVFDRSWNPPAVVPID